MSRDKWPYTRNSNIDVTSGAFADGRIREKLEIPPVRPKSGEKVEYIDHESLIKGVKVHKGGGQKHNSGKLPYYLITKEMMDALAEALQLGMEKGYPERNWEKGLPICEASLSSAISHIFKYQSGVDYNVEDKLDGSGKCKEVHHLACAMVNIGMAITQIKRGREDLDDRAVK
jgi:hypothetical protein